MTKAREKEKGKAKVKVEIEQDRLALQELLKKRRKSHADFTLVMGRRVQKEEIVNIVIPRTRLGANSPAGAKKSVCYAFLQGKCTKGKDCKYIHDKKALAVVKSTVKAASSKGDGITWSNSERRGSESCAVGEG